MNYYCLVLSLTYFDCDSQQFISLLCLLIYRTEALSELRRLVWHALFLLILTDRVDHRECRVSKEILHFIVVVLFSWDHAWRQNLFRHLLLPKHAFELLLWIRIYELWSGVYHWRLYLIRLVVEVLDRTSAEITWQSKRFKETLLILINWFIHFLSLKPLGLIRLKIWIWMFKHFVKFKIIKLML